MPRLTIVASVMVLAAGVAQTAFGEQGKGKAKGATGRDRVPDSCFLHVQ